MTETPDAPVSLTSDEDDDDFVVPDETIDLHESAEDVEIAEVSNMDDLQPDDGQDEEATDNA